MAAASFAEQQVHDRLRSALPAEYRIYPNVRWILKRGPADPARDGETDLVIVHPRDGLLIVETKGGLIRRDNTGRWFSGSHQLKISPFKQAEDSKHALRRKITGLPDWLGSTDDLRAGHAVAFPDVGVRTGAHQPDLGPDAPIELAIDQADLASDQLASAAVERAYRYWIGDGRRGQPLSDAHLRVIDDILAPSPLQLTPVLRRQIAEGEAAVVTLTKAQYHVLDMLRSQRRAAIVGPAGCGKTMLAAEKAGRLAREGYRTLLVCFNQPLARSLSDDLGHTEWLEVSTFHELCLSLGREAQTLPDPEPTEKGSDWFSDTLPKALDKAIGILGPRYHAIVVDEGQDFERSWLESLQLLLIDQEGDVIYVFHDPGQALFREDVVASLGMPEYTVDWNCRNPRPIHDFAARHTPGLGTAEVLREEGRKPELIEAEPGRDTLEQLRKVLHRLVMVDGVRPWQIAVLTARSLAKSDAWRQRTFGDQVLWNGAYDSAGASLGLSAADLPEQPSDTVLVETIRRFKGLEREVIVLVELDPADQRLNQLIYVGATRARQHLIVIAPAGAVG